MRKFDMTLEQYDAMLEAQGGGCGAFLCFRCDNALADFQEDTDLLHQAISYLSDRAHPRGGRGDRAGPGPGAQPASRVTAATAAS